MPILIDIPIVKPATPEIKFDKLYATTITIQVIRDEDKKPVDSSAVVTLTPYNMESNTDLPTAPRTMTIRSIGSRIRAEPRGAFAQAYGALLSAVSEEFDRQFPKPAEDPVDPSKTPDET